MIPFSVLDLAPIPEGATASDAFRDTLAVAREADRLRFQRYWLAEHHNMPGVGSAATSVLVGYVAGGTTTIRVGSGGVMLPNHAPYVIAEQFGTLAALYPNRIDLGLGRAPGTDPLTIQALRRDPTSAAREFPSDVQELQAWLAPARPGQRIQAVPGAGSQVPIWILGSSIYGAELAAILGLPYAFASHFAPGQMVDAIRLYRSRFQPSAQLDRPHVMLTVSALAGDTEAEARRQFTSVQQSFVNLRRGAPGRIPPPIDDIEAYWTPFEKAMVSDALRYAFVGSKATVAAGIREFLATHAPDELMVTANGFDVGARIRSLQLVAEIRDAL